MANIPLAGFPTIFPRHGNAVVSIELVGDRKLLKTLQQFERAMPMLRTRMLRELGLFGEYETKSRTPVDFGPLRASIGHYRGNAIETPNSSQPDGSDVTSADAKAAAIWTLTSESVTWGSSLHYAAHVEHGFTVRSRRLIYIERVGFRWINPFSYRGAHMFHLGLAATVKAAPLVMERSIVAQWKKLNT